MYPSLTKGLVVMSRTSMLPSGMITLMGHIMWLSLWLVSSVSYAESLTESFTVPGGQELSECTALREVLSSPQFTRKQLSDHLAPSSPPQSSLFGTSENSGPTSDPYAT